MEIERISKLIKELRKEKNLTQEELGDLLGVSGKAVSKWERGESLPDVAIVKKLSDTLDISSDELLQGKINRGQKEVSNRNKYLLLLLTPLLAIIVGIIIFNEKNENRVPEIISEEGNDNNSCTLIKTFYIDDIMRSNDEHYLYVTLHEYQVEGVFTIKLSKVIGQDLEEDNNYEFAFTIPKDYTLENTEILFNKYKIINIEKTDKVGMNQTNEFYC